MTDVVWAAVDETGEINTVSTDKADVAEIPGTDLVQFTPAGTPDTCDAIETVLDFLEGTSGETARFDGPLDATPYGDQDTSMFPGAAAISVTDLIDAIATLRAVTGTDPQHERVDAAVEEVQLHPMCDDDVVVSRDQLETVLDFVEWDSALDHPPATSDVPEAIAALRTALNQTPEHPTVQTWETDQ